MVAVTPFSTPLIRPAEADAVSALTLDGAARARVDTAPGGLPWARVRRVAEYVQANLSGQLTLAELSAVVHMSPYHFARLFKVSVGISPRQFVIRQRIERAKRLLREHRVYVGEVARAV